MNYLKRLNIIFCLSIFAIKAHEKPVYKHIFDNGFSVLVHPVKTLQKVSVQLWFGVGSKHEKEGEKGLAHWLEHMLLKGTKGPLKMSETDFFLVNDKLSGNANASTTVDWTHYFYNLPVQYWHEALPIFAEIMQHCRFDQEMLNSELKVVIQELKMYRDNYARRLHRKMLSSIFNTHPYHYPTIGYKQDLWNLSAKQLEKFYKKHYIPNNALLVVVGNVDPEDVFEKAKACFDSIPANFDYEPKEQKAIFDICSYQTTLYRDIKLPFVHLYYVIPGIKERNPFFTDILNFILTGGKSSRLYKKLVDQDKLVNSIGSDTALFFDHDIFFFGFEPYDMNKTNEIIDIIHQEFTRIKTEGISNEELEAALQCMKSNHCHLLESNYQQAEAIAQSYLAQRDENFIYNYIIEDKETINNEIKNLITTYLRPIVTHKGIVLPLPDEEKENLSHLQQESDIEDQGILAGKERTSPIEPGNYVNKIEIQDIPTFDIPKPQEFVLENGLKVLYLHNDTIPKIQIILDLKINNDYEPKSLLGLSKIFCNMLYEGGLKSYTNEEFAKELKKYGIGLSISDGSIAMSNFSQDLKKALTLLNEVLCHAQFDEKELDKVKKWALADIKDFWDNPNAIQSHLISQHFYKNHPYSKLHLGTEESIDKITKKDLVNYYKKYSTPHEATLILVGDLKSYNLPDILENTLGSWQGDKLADIPYPTLERSQPQTINHYIERDQVCLAFVQPSIDRFNEDFHALTIFNTVLNKYLFKLREFSGAFYWINGDTLAGTGKQPGLSIIKTQVSKDRLQEAENMIRQALQSIPDMMTEQDIEEAKRKLLQAPADWFSTISSIANAFSFLNSYNLSFNYFEEKAEIINNITLEDVKEAAKKVLNPEKLSVFKVGRIS